jgi:hypothetical protein
MIHMIYFTVYSLWIPPNIRCIYSAGIHHTYGTTYLVYIHGIFLKDTLHIPKVYLFDIQCIFNWRYRPFTPVIAHWITAPVEPAGDRQVAIQKSQNLWQNLTLLDDIWWEIPTFRWIFVVKSISRDKRGQKLLKSPTHLAHRTRDRSPMWWISYKMLARWVKPIEVTILFSFPSFLIRVILWEGKKPCLLRQVCQVMPTVLPCASLCRRLAKPFGCIAYDTIHQWLWCYLIP